MNNNKGPEVLSDREMNSMPTLFNLLVEKNKDRSPICYLQEAGEKY